MSWTRSSSESSLELIKAQFQGLNSTIGQTYDQNVYEKFYKRTDIVRSQLCIRLLHLQQNCSFCAAGIYPHKYPLKCDFPTLLFDHNND